MEKKNLRILTLSSLYPRGLDPIPGIFVHNQVKCLRNNGCEIMVVSPVAVPFIPVAGQSTWKDLNMIKHHDTRDGIKIFYPRYLYFPKRMLRKYSFPIEFLCIKRVVQSAIHTFHPDILHVYTATPDGVIGLLIRKVFSLPLVVSLIGSDINVWPFRSKLIYRLTKQVIAEADSVIAVSNALKRKAEEIVSPKNPISVIYMGHDPSKFAFDEVARFNLRKKLDIPGKSIAFIFIGNILKTKGIFELLEAFCLLIKKMPDAYLIFVGDGKDKKRLIKKAVKTGISNRVIFIGRRQHNKIPHWLSMSDILILPSYSEGLPNAVVEAMACQRPVIATNVGGIPEVIVDGKSGILVEPKDAVALAEAMQRVAYDKDLRVRLGNQGRKIVREKFSWEENIKKLINLYKSIAR